MWSTRGVVYRLYLTACIAEVTVVGGNHGNTVLDPDSTDYVNKLKKINR